MHRMHVLLPFWHYSPEGGRGRPPRVNTDVQICGCLRLSALATNDSQLDDSGNCVDVIRHVRRSFRVTTAS